MSGFDWFSYAPEFEVVFVEHTGKDPLKCDLCGAKFVYGSRMYFECNEEGPWFAHKSCVNDNTRCRFCNGRGYILPHQDMIRAIVAPFSKLGTELLGEPARPARCQECKGRGYVRKRRP